ncbi:MAG: four helix bundle protein [Saprospiraceae bacterium]|nr:four helix bundle protein [Saprospiraceae bacterium]
MFFWESLASLVVHIYRNTSGFPDTEKYGLLTQIRRSAVSICSNIAEGSGATKPMTVFLFNSIVAAVTQSNHYCTRFEFTCKRT